ncbi:MAG: DUF86 domain-containing protein [Bacteroidota bacterium]|nr:DUF86 domain-containing protein [Bacteroidota bacterium]
MKSDITFLKHILDEINFLLKETKGQSFDQFIHDELTKRAYSRSLEIIGEAVKNISPSLKKKHKEIEWKKMAGLRDKIIHHYFGVNYDILWDTIKNKLPGLKTSIGIILKMQKD